MAVNNLHSKNVVVIGAGYTGLVAARELAKKGAVVTILERGDTVGGLASDFKVEGASLERAYHHLFKTDVHIIELAEELGISNKLEWHKSSVSIFYNGVLYPFNGALDLIRFKPLRFINRVRTGLVVFYLQLTSRYDSMKSISAYSWMKKYSGKQVTEVIWEPLLKGKFNRYYDKVAMAWLWARIHIRAQSRDKGGEKLGYFSGGFQTFTDALVKDLESRGVKIKTGVLIESITNDANNNVIISVQNKEQLKFDACIATTPSHVFAKLIETNVSVKKSYIKQLNSIDYLGARLLIFSSKQDLSNYYWHNINDIKLPFLVFINHTKLMDKRNYGGYNIYYVATYLPHDHEMFSLSNEDLEKLWLPALKVIFPNFDSSAIHEKYHFRFANAQHIVDTDYSSKIPSNNTPLANVYLSNFSQIFPEDRGTNYAVREGKKIAKLLTK